MFNFIKLYIRYLIAWRKGYYTVNFKRAPLESPIAVYREMREKQIWLEAARAKVKLTKKVGWRASNYEPASTESKNTLRHIGHGKTKRLF